MIATLLFVFGVMAETDSSRAAVVCAEVSFSLAAEGRDLEAFRNRLDADARFISWEILHGPDEIVAGWQGFFEPDGPEIRWRPAIVEVVPDGSLAISRGPYRIRGRDEQGNVREAWGTFNSVWRRQPDGEWKVLFDAGGDHGKTPTDEDRRILAQDPEC